MTFIAGLRFTRKASQASLLQRLKIMLCISRKVREGFTIGDNIRVVIIDCGGGKVRIGIDAPRDVRILRDELDDHNQPPRDKPKAA